MIKLLESIKSKIGNGQSYPVNTTQISKELENIFQYSKLSIYYDNKDGKSLGEISFSKTSGRNVKQDVSDLLAFQEVISASYSHFNTKWSIHVQQVNSTNRDNVNRFILSRGLPLIKAWLIEHRTETWYNGHRYLRIGLNNAADQYAIRESLNDQLIKKQIFEITV